MNKQIQQLLETVINAIIEEDTDAAKAAFHDYLRIKSQRVLMGESVDEDDKEDSKSDKDEDDKKDDDKEDSKSDKKKDKKEDKSEEDDEDCKM